MHKYKFNKLFILIIFFHIKNIYAGCLELQLINFALQKNEISIEQCLKGNVHFDVNATDEQGKTLLIHACENNLRDTVKLLLSYNIIIDHFDNTGKTALMHSTLQNNIDITTLLLSSNANPNIADDTNQIPLHIATALDNADMVKLLLKYKSDIEAKDVNNNNALLIAAALEHVQIIQLLLSENVNLEAKNIYGDTALMIAVMNSNKAVTEQLLLAGANPFAQNNMNETPLKKALANKDLVIISLIYDSIAESYFWGEKVIIDYNAARIFYEKILNTKLDNIPVLKTKANYYLGIIHFKGHGVPINFEKSLNHFKRVNPEHINSNETHATLNLYLGLIFSNQSLYCASDEIAHNHLMKANSMYLNEDDMAKKYLTLGLINKRKMNFSVAIEYLNILIEKNKNPENIALGFLNLADIYYFLNDYMIAIQNYNNILKMNGTISRTTKSIAHFKLGKMYHMGNGVPADYNRALSHFLEADNNDLNENGVILKNYFVGNIYFHLKKIDHAIEYLQNSSNQSTNKLFSVLSKLLLSRCFYKTNNMSLAMDFANAVADSNIDENAKANGILLLGKININIGKYSSAVNYFNNLINQFTDKKIVAIAHFFLAKIYLDGIDGQINYDLVSKHINAICPENLYEKYKTEFNNMILTFKSKEVAFSKERTELLQSHR